MYGHLNVKITFLVICESFFSTSRTFSKICTLKQLKYQFLKLIASVLNPDKHNTVFFIYFPTTTFGHSMC